MVCPEDAATGLTPHSAAKDASVRMRSGLPLVVTSRAAAVSGPTPGVANKCGVARPWGLGSGVGVLAYLTIVGVIIPGVALASRPVPSGLASRRALVCPVSEM